MTQLFADAGLADIIYYFVNHVLYRNDAEHFALPLRLLFYCCRFCMTAAAFLLYRSSFSIVAADDHS